MNDPDENDDVKDFAKCIDLLAGLFIRIPEEELRKVLFDSYMIEKLCQNQN